MKQLIQLLFKKRSGSVVLFALMMLSIIVFLTQQLMRGVFVGSSFTKTMVDREHAEMLALSGINVAIAQLVFDERDQKEEKKVMPSENKQSDVGENKESRALKKYLSRTIPYLNRWQDFELKETTDGIDGLIKICVTCESGKININEAFDFKTMEFKKEYAVLFKRLEIPGRVPLKEGEVLTRLTRFLKARKRKLDDISELQNVVGLESLDIFYHPPQAAPKGKKSQPNKDLALQDIFTLWSSDDKIDPLWLSDSMCAILDLRRPLADDAVVHKERYRQFLQNLKKDMAGDWDGNWKVLENIYEQKPRIIPDIKNIFTKVFGPKVFSVLSCGKVGQVEQSVLAVIREEDRKKKSADKQQDQSSEARVSTKQETEKFFKVLRIYWL